jgi:hypothetical protein
MEENRFFIYMASRFYLCGSVQVMFHLLTRFADEYLMASAVLSVTEVCYSTMHPTQGGAVIMSYHAT